MGNPIPSSSRESARRSLRRSIILLYLAVCPIGGCGGDTDINENASSSGSPAPINSSHIVELEIISQYTCARYANGAVRCQGDLLYIPDDPASLLSDVVDIDAGPHHVCAVTGAGEVFCWGKNINGELGLSGYQEETRVPQRISDIDDAIAVEAAAGYTCALTQQREVYCLGRSSSYLAGTTPDNGRLVETTTRKVQNLPEITQIDNGYNHTCSLSTQGDVYCWGNNSFGEIGIERSSTFHLPTHVALPGVVVQLDSYSRGTCALLADGTVYCWGSNFYGEQGNNTNLLAAPPMKVANLNGATSISAGLAHVCALSATGLYCWGSNSSFQVYEYPPEERSDHWDVLTPYLKTFDFGDIDRIYSGSNQSCAFVDDPKPKIYCWGAGKEGFHEFGA